MTVFLVIFLSLVALNALLLLFSSNLRFRAGKPSGEQAPETGGTETYPLGSRDSGYQEAV